MYERLSRFAHLVNAWSGSPLTGLAALLIVVLWIIGGVLFGFGNTYQLLINTGTTIVTFVVVFFIQHSTNVSGAAIQLKLDNIQAAIEQADNRLIGAEDFSESEIKALRAQLARSVEETTPAQDDSPS